MQPGCIKVLGVPNPFPQQPRVDNSRLKAAIAGLLLMVYALLPAAGWAHHHLEAVNHSHTHDVAIEDLHDSETPDHPQQHQPHPHDESHCHLCHMIHVAGKQMILIASVEIAAQERCDIVQESFVRESPSVDVIGIHPSRAPPVNL